MKKLIQLFIFIALGLLATQAWSYQYISAEDARGNLEQQSSMLLVDIQIEPEFNQHHLPGALPTYAYPVKSDSDRSKLAALLPQLQDSTAPVVVVCPRGGGGAKRAYDYLEEQGIAPERLFILEKGQQGWPYPELLAQ
ncbi:rhodanese-like domain-containing protein [Malonomonas rubra]|uniref:rhodanese-like domain-containing protein n=1 Tax=Malonomonas rubra TaxID=57040 RepID=UPI0026EF97A6|nr:rhodanese-like domain-containing protein [Malonomonas rubra]